ncbi:MAG: hypothetical protein IH840_05380 [Candidatus Heimdallarchaeota archaeon]|nr:hypothetical protein [Candidatus Heimdallarchaeota archaeon]
MTIYSGLIPDDFGDELELLCARLETSSKTGPLAVRLSRHLLVSLAENLNRINNDSYSTSSPWEILALMNILMGAEDLTEVEALVNVGEADGHLWRIRSLLQQWVNLNLGASKRGIESRHIFVIQDWLEFSADEEAFLCAKRFAASGLQVKVVQRSALPIAIEGDQVTLRYAQIPSCSVKLEPDLGSSEFVVLKPVLSVEEVNNHRALFEIAWDSPGAVSLTAI